MKASCAIDAVVTKFSNFEKFWFCKWMFFKIFNIFFLGFDLRLGGRWRSSRDSRETQPGMLEKTLRKLSYYSIFVSYRFWANNCQNMWKTITISRIEKGLSLLNFLSCWVNFTTSFLPKTFQFYPSKSHNINYKLKTQPFHSCQNSWEKNSFSLLKY